MEMGFDDALTPESNTQHTHIALTIVLLGFWPNKTNGVNPVALHPVRVNEPVRNHKGAEKSTPELLRLSPSPPPPTTP